MGRYLIFSGFYYKTGAQNKSINLNTVVTGERCKVTSVTGIRQTHVKEIKETNNREMVMVLSWMWKVLFIWQHAMLSCCCPVLLKHTEKCLSCPFCSNGAMLSYISFLPCTGNVIFSLEIKPQTHCLLSQNSEKNNSKNKKRLNYS